MVVGPARCGKSAMAQALVDVAGALAVTVVDVRALVGRGPMPSPQTYAALLAPHFRQAGDPERAATGCIVLDGLEALRVAPWDEGPKLLSARICQGQLAALLAAGEVPVHGGLRPQRARVDQLLVIGMMRGEPALSAEGDVEDIAELGLLPELLEHVAAIHTMTPLGLMDAGELVEHRLDAHDALCQREGARLAVTEEVRRHLRTLAMRSTDAVDAALDAALAGVAFEHFPLHPESGAEIQLMYQAGALVARLSHEDHDGHQTEEDGDERR